MNCEKSNFRKSLHEWNGHLKNFSRAQVLENPRQYLLLRTEFCRISRWVPLLKLPGSLIFKKKLLFSNSLIIHDVISQPERSIRVRWMTLKLNETPVENHQCFFTFSSPKLFLICIIIDYSNLVPRVLSYPPYGPGNEVEITQTQLNINH